MNILRFGYSVTATVLMLLTIFTGQTIYAQTTYTTNFESPVFTLGDINGQNGWGYLSNSPTKGVIETPPRAIPAIATRKFGCLIIPITVPGKSESSSVGIVSERVFST